MVKLILKVRFTENLLNLEVKKVAGIGRPQHDGDIGAAGSAADNNNILIGTHQASISGHHRYLTDNLHSLPEDTQGISDNVPDDIGIKLLAHGGTEAAKEVGGSIDCATFVLN